MADRSFRISDGGRYDQLIGTITLTDEAVIEFESLADYRLTPILRQVRVGAGFLYELAGFNLLPMPANQSVRTYKCNKCKQERRVSKEEAMTIQEFVERLPDRIPCIGCGLTQDMRLVPLGG